jgi:LysM repeat protein
MNNTSPLVPQGSLIEQKNKGRSRLKTAFFCVLAIHIIPIMVALLMQGCRRVEQPPVTEADTNVYAPPLFDPTTLPPPETVTPAVPDYTPPPPDTYVPPAPPAATREHVVVSGDTFSGIAVKYGVSVKAIQDANPNVEPTKLQIGQKIQIPPPTTAAPTSSPTAPAGSGQIYVVQSGDSLTKIAQDHGTTVKALRDLNNLRTDRIKVGDKLKIPAKTTSP